MLSFNKPSSRFEGDGLPEGRRNKQHKPRRPLRSIAMLPTLLTLGNLSFGFLALCCCAMELQELGSGLQINSRQTLGGVFWENRAPSYLAVAFWAIIGGMICDALDGRVARKTGQSSKFGIQLDSLADVVSFGAAPALMMITLVHRELAQFVQGDSVPLGSAHFSKISLLIGVIYICCAALRLARFNVEATLEEASHQGFKGLPTPAAAAAVITLIFLHDHLEWVREWTSLNHTIIKLLPACTLMVALLMVSRVPYTHAVSHLLRRRPLGHVVLILLLLPPLILYTEVMVFAVAWLFVLTGVVRKLWSLRPGTPKVVDVSEPAAPMPDSFKEKRVP